MGPIYGRLSKYKIVTRDVLLTNARARAVTGLLLLCQLDRARPSVRRAVTREQARLIKTHLPGAHLASPWSVLPGLATYYSAVKYANFLLSSSLRQICPLATLGCLLSGLFVLGLCALMFALLNMKSLSALRSGLSRSTTATKMA